MLDKRFSSTEGDEISKEASIAKSSHSERSWRQFGQIFTNPKIYLIPDLTTHLRNDFTTVYRYIYTHTS